ncbi:YceI family protein [Pedobacter sp. P351]|uniref:YceI family protein n=1 Tax=Pedobacter superstes TaxID=3133441 RepID=UPI00309629F1
MKALNFNTSKLKNHLGQFLTLILLIGFGSFSNTVSAQVPFKNITGSQFKVNGTSNIHNWVMNATSFSCDGKFILKGDQLIDITALNFTLPVTNLKGKEDLLNTRAHKALKAEQFNKITFKLTNATVVPLQKIIRANGNLTIGGVTKPVSLQTNYTVNGDELTCKGSKDIKMSDYNIKAPSFMLGALKVANEVTVDITLKLKN